MSPADKEFLCVQIRRYLVERHPCAFSASSICQMMESRGYIDFDITPADVEAQLIFLKQDGQVAECSGLQGVTKCYQATPDGIRQHNRG